VDRVLVFGVIVVTHLVTGGAELNGVGLMGAPLDAGQRKTAGEEHSQKAGYAQADTASEKSHDSSTLFFEWAD